MADIAIADISYTGSLPSAYSSATTCSFGYTIGSDANSYWDLITISETYGTYKVGYLTFTNSGSRSLTVRVINGSVTKTGSISSGSSYTIWVNYNHNDSLGQNYFYIDVPNNSQGGGGGTITIQWQSASRELVEGTNYTINNPTYDGNSHYGLSQLSHCSAVQTARTNAGTYQETIYADNGSIQFVDCWYFIHPSTGEPVPQRTISWTINKADQTWTLRPTSVTMLPNSSDGVVIDGNWAGNISAYITTASIATITSINQGTGGITFSSNTTTGSTIISVSTPGNSNINSRTQTATITVTSGDKCVRIYHNGAWGRYVPYIYHNGSWQKAVAYVYTNNQWKEVDS